MGVERMATALWLAIQVQRFLEWREERRGRKEARKLEALFDEEFIERLQEMNRKRKEEQDGCSTDD